MNNEPTNHELLHYLQDVKADVVEIRVQTSRTNGRVGKLENWQNFIMGGLAVLALMVVPVIIYLINHWK